MPIQCRSARLGCAARRKDKVDPMISVKRAGAVGALRCLVGVFSVLAVCAGITLAAAPAKALAADSSAAASQSQLIVRGADTLQIGGSSFECATVADLGGGTLYADISVDGSVATKDMEYRFDKADDTFGIVQLDTKASYVAKHSGNILLDFYTAKSDDRQGASPVLSANVYAVCVQVDGAPVGSVEESMIGIRTARAAEAELAIEAPTQIVRGGVCYKLAGNGKAVPTLKDGVLYVSYEKADEAQSVSGTVIYVDENGNQIASDSYLVAAGEQKSVALRSSIEANDTVYTPLSAVPQVTLSVECPEVRIYCVARAEADKTTQDVTITYVSSDGKQLMVDRVKVGAGGYFYAPATAFSRANDASVMRYTLAGATDSLGNTYTAEQAKELSLTREGAKEYTLQYQPEETELTYTVNFALVSAGKNGNTNVHVAKSEQAKVSASQAAVVALPETIEQDGVTYTRFGGEGQLSYSWSDLQSSRMLSDTVYYVASDVAVPEAYDVKVRYVDAVSGTELGGETLTCNPDGSVLSIGSPESVSFEGKEYQRLNGQSAPITHRFYAPYRTYTVYYAQPGSMSQGDVTVVRTEVVDGGIRYYTIASDGTVTAGSADGASTGGLIATTPYTSVVSEDAAASANGGNAQASNSDVTAPSGNSAYEERIDEDQTPLSSGDGQQAGLGAAQIAGIVLAVVALAAIAFFAARAKRNSDGDKNGMGA